MQIVKKEKFILKEYTFENGRTIPVQMGYETYGTLNREIQCDFDLSLF